MENFFEREMKRLAFVEERMKIRAQEKIQRDAEETKRQQVRCLDKSQSVLIGRTLTRLSWFTKVCLFAFGLERVDLSKQSYSKGSHFNSLARITKSLFSWSGSGEVQISFRTAAWMAKKRSSTDLREFKPKRTALLFLKRTKS